MDHGCWTTRVSATRVDTDNGLHRIIDAGSESRAFHLTSGSGLSLGAELRLGRRAGVELRLLAAELDSLFVLDRESLWVMDENGIGFLSFCAAFNLHLTPDGPVDLYLGPVIGISDFRDQSYSLAGERFRQELDGDLLLGIQAGMDVPWGRDSPWGVSLAVRYLDSSAELTGGVSGDFDIDPVVLSFGVAYSWPSGTGSATKRRTTEPRDGGPGGRVAVELELGERPLVKMPDVTGLGLEHASALLERLHLRLAEPVTRVPGERPAGEVMAQDPPPGSLVRWGSAVALTVSAGGG